MNESIAIIGIGCRFPGASSAGAFWDLLIEGRIATGPPPASRPEWAGASVGGYLDDVASFDAGMFGIKAHEARLIDPQQRLMLDVAAQAIENAGVPRRQLAGQRTGVFIGSSTHDYAVLYWKSGQSEAAASTGTSTALVANRISHWLGAGGPSMTIDTACSSALVAAHAAVQAIRNDEIDYALVGGVSLLLLPSVTEAFDASGVLSRAGRCRSFESKADGYVRSEGAGVILLARASVAQRNSSRIYAEIRGTAVNHNGVSNGLTAPNPSAQAAVIEAASRAAGLASASDLQYVEAMGSATILGDALELKALASTRAETSAPLLLGSVKANLGHMEAASGIGALIKTALSLYWARIPPAPGFDAPSESLERNRRRIEVPRTAIDWPANPGSRLAGVSSFGFGGSNAHVVVADAKPVPRERREIGQYLLILSARNEQALDARYNEFRDYLRRTQDHPLDIAFTLSAGCDHYPYRLALAGRDCHTLAGAPAWKGVAPARAPRLGLWAGKFGDASTIHQVEHLMGLGLSIAGISDLYGVSDDLRHWAGHRNIAVGGKRFDYLLSLESAGGLYATTADGRIGNMVLSSMDPWPESLWASLFVCGFDLNCAGLYDGIGAVKVTLPSQPRTLERYWMGSASTSNMPPPSSEMPAAESQFDREIRLELELLGY